ncbi:hypothetical protein AB0M41_38880 [Streptomyces sp. NPDC051896]|uniref:hypothetical protein n=1 Tax=Streptomyces sp. NPDC051896 TaxID=3155416 RepID=UPI0034386B20
MRLRRLLPAAEARRHVAGEGRREKGAEKSSRKADATPEFFQPGHTYAGSGGWKFHCDTLTAHPEDGELTALGWRFFNGSWQPIAYEQDDWEAHQANGHTDVTDGGGA